MRVIIAGAGSVGRYMAGQLQSAGHEVTLLDQDQRVVKRGMSSGDPAGVAWREADGCEVSSLADAGAQHADVIAAVTGDDEDNLVISLLAKQEFGVPRVVARVNNPKNEWMFNEMWGVDVAVSTPHLLTALVEEAVSVGSFVRLLSFEGGKAKLAEVPRDSTVVAVLRNDHVVVPRGDTTVRAGDEVIVLVTTDSEDAVRLILTGN
jgi:trk system potassium uptake protein